MKNYQRLAQTLQAHDACQEKGNTEWIEKHQDTIDKIMKGAPSGSGFDRGTKVVQLDGHKYENSLVFETAFHHMDENGFYAGWTEHKITVRAHLAFGFTLSVGGRDRNQIKDYIADTFHHWLESEESV